MFIQPKPRIDYTLKAVGGSLTAIPGISDMIDVSFDYDTYHCSLNGCFYVAHCVSYVPLGRIL